MLIGGGITLAVVAGVKKVKNVLVKRKAKNEEPVMVVSDNENEIIEEEE